MMFEYMKIDWMPLRWGKRLKSVECNKKIHMKNVCKCSICKDVFEIVGFIHRKGIKYPRWEIYKDFPKYGMDEELCPNCAGTFWEGK